MEKIEPRIYWKIAVMKKAFGFAASFVLIMISANAQSEKKEPPPPPPKPKNETVKYDPPKVIMDEKAKVKKIEGDATEPPVITVKGQKADEFYQRNPSVAGISRKGSVIMIKKKDGTSEKYDMSKKEDDKSFTDKYGVSPIPPPPPPPKQKSKA